MQVSAILPIQRTKFNSKKENYPQDQTFKEALLKAQQNAKTRDPLSKIEFTLSFPRS